MSDSTPITDTFYIVLQKGIEGGFAPPTPKARYTITRATNSDNFLISVEARDDGTPSLKHVKAQHPLKIADHRDDISRFQALVKDIPTQYPGAQDLYGRNVSLLHVTEYNQTGELMKSGSAAATAAGVRPPTDEEKAKFDEAVAIVEKWAK